MTARVAASEAALLDAVRAILSAAPVSQLRRSLRRRDSMPDKLGPTAMALLEDALRKGVVAALVRRGAWRHRRALVDGAAVQGRLWSLRPSLSLRFTEASFALCRWIAGGKTKLRAPKTAADELLHYLVAHAFVRADLALTPFKRSALVWLGFAHKMAGEVPTLRWSRLLTGNGQIVIEALQPDLTSHWVAMEREKSRVRDAAVLSDIGLRQRGVLASYLDAIEVCGRRDLATFAINAAAELVHRPAHAWTEGLTASVAPLAQRAAASKNTASFLRMLDRIAVWRSELSTVAFFDDNYAEAQLLLDSWEQLGIDGFRRAANLADELESLRTLTPAQADE